MSLLEQVYATNVSRADVRCQVLQRFPLRYRGELGTDRDWFVKQFTNPQGGLRASETSIILCRAGSVVRQRAQESGRRRSGTER